MAERVDTASKTGRLRLISQKEMDRLGSFPLLLKSLDASNCDLKRVPVDLGKFVKLTTLKLNANPALEQLPLEELCALVNLKTLDLSHTRISKIEIFPQTKLTHLNLSNCAFHGDVGFPDLALPRSLIELDLSGNSLISGLSPSFGFEALEFLEDLSLSYTGLQSLPAAIGELKRLSCLRLENTLVEQIPESLFLRTPISRLELRGSHITKKAFLEMPGVNEFLKRRQERLDRDVAGGVIVDTSLCGLD